MPSNHDVVSTANAGPPKPCSVRCRCSTRVPSCAYVRFRVWRRTRSKNDRSTTYPVTMM